MTSSRPRRVPAMLAAFLPWRSSGRRALYCILLQLLFLPLSGEAARSFAADLERWSPPVMPELSLATLDGGMRNLADGARGVVLVHFFATWCEPCRGELRQLDALAARMSERPLLILSVDVGEPAARIRRFFASNPVRFSILLDPDRASMKAWGVETFPTTFVLGPSSCPLWRVSGELDWLAPESLTRLESALADAEHRQTASTPRPCQTPGETR